MNVLVSPVPLSGTVRAIPSKSEAHRALICASFADAPTRIICGGTSKDIEATIACLHALGVAIEGTDEGFEVAPVKTVARDPLLDCGESGSTLRFMLPIVAALGQGARLAGRGRLLARPLAPLDAELVRHGTRIERGNSFIRTLPGPLCANRLVCNLPGNVSSQYATGILLAAPLLAGGATVCMADPVESRPYIDLTKAAMGSFGVLVDERREDGRTIYTVPAGSAYTSPATIAIGGDWSGAAFWLAAGSLSSTGIRVEGLDMASKQADRTVLAALSLFGAQPVRAARSAAVAPAALHAASFDVSSCPDLVPAIAPIAALAPGTSRIFGAQRLRLKESDRLATISAALKGLGARVGIDGDALVFEGVGSFSGGTVDAANDHRIAMMAAIAATRASGPVRIIGAECVAKSYPSFFDDFRALGGEAREEA